MSACEPASGGPLPRLRAGLRLDDVGTPGAPRWTLHDPVRERYHRIGWLEAELLARLDGNDSASVLAAVNETTPLRAEPDALAALIDWLEREQLIAVDGPEGLTRLTTCRVAKKGSVWATAFRFTLYAKRRLLNPERLLERLNRWLAPVLDRPRVALGALSVLALAVLLALPGHGGDLADTVSSHLNPGGLALFVLTLVFTNVVHEFGHGIVAARLGCRVRAMGVALVFMMPVAWCDTSDAWRLKRRADRLKIDAGGIAIEALLALVALACWLVLPDGIARSLAFFVAASSLVTTLLVNLNPFMKFDGYYLLADSLGIENLQARSFAALKWRLRVALFGSQAPPPEPMTARRRHVLCTYAACTWVYRLFLYLAIGWLVYTFWFKALGILLAIATLGLLLVKPVLGELGWAIGEARRQGLGGRRLSTCLVVLALVALTLIPLPRAIDAPAMLVPAASAQLFTPVPARVARVHVKRGDRVRAGDVMVTLHDPALAHEVARELATREALIESLRSSGADTLVEVPAAWRERAAIAERSGQARAVLASGSARLAEHDARLAAARRALDRLTLRAPIDGVVVDVDPSLGAGRWLPANTIAASIATTDQPVVRAYLASVDAERVAPFVAERPSGIFTSRDGAFDLSLELISVERAGIDALGDEALSVPEGGPIAVRAADVDARALTARVASPINDHHLATLAVSDPVPLPGERPGYVRLTGKPVSLARRAAVRLYGAFVRESGF